MLAAGAQAFSVYNHMLLPLLYESWEADYRHLLDRVQLWDVSVERQVEIRGRNALALVELMTPRDVGTLRVTLEDGSEREVAVTGEDWSVPGGLHMGV